MTGRSGPDGRDRVVRALAVAALVFSLLPACASWFPPATPPTRTPENSAVWFRACPVDEATVSSIVGIPVRQITPDDETPWCQFNASRESGLLAVMLDDRPDKWPSLAAARRQYGEPNDLGCTQADAPALGADAFTSSCAGSDDYRFSTGKVLFTMDGAIKQVSLNGTRQRDPVELSGMAVAVAQRVVRR